MKHPLLLFCIYTLLFALPAILPAQTFQKGKVVLQNSGYQPLPSVQVTAYGAQPTDTDNGGLFSLNFDKAAPGELAPLKEVYKKGYELVNKNETERWILSDTKEMLVVMCPIGSLREAREKYYNIGNSTYIKRYENTLSQIEKQKEDNLLVEKEYADKLEKAYDELINSQKRLLEYSDIFSRINKDDLSSVESKAFSLLEKGQLDEAIALYENEKLLERLQQQIEVKTVSITNINEMIPSLKRYAEMCMFAGGKENIDKASKIYKVIAGSDLNNYQNIFEYGIFLQKQSDYQAAIEWLQKALEIAQTKQSIGETLNVLGETYILQKNYMEAEKALANSSKVYDILSEELSPGYKQYKAVAICNMGSLYLAVNDYQKSLDYISEAQNINESFIEDSIIYLDNKAHIHTIRGTIGMISMMRSFDEYDHSETRSDLELAVSISHDLVKKDSVKYLDFLLSSLSNLAVFYKENKEYEDAERVFLRALEINEQRYKKNPDLAQVELATIYSNIGKFYLSKKDFQSTFDYLSKAIEMREELAKKNPNAFIPSLSTSYNDLGTLYGDSGDCEKAIDCFLRSISLREQMEELNESSQIVELATTYLNIASAYETCNSYAKAEEYYYKALSSKDEFPEVDLSFLYKNAILFLTQLYLYTDNPAYQEVRKEFKVLFDYDEHGEAAYWYIAGNSAIENNYPQIKTTKYFTESLNLYELCLKSAIPIHEIAAVEFCYKMGEYFYDMEDYGTIIRAYNIVKQIIPDVAIIEKNEDLLWAYYSVAFNSGLAYMSKRMTEDAIKSVENSLLCLNYLEQLYPGIYQEVISKVTEILESINPHQ